VNYRRYIAIGDSFTEGMCDDLVNGEYRGWADRVADALASHESGQHGFEYANLAIRGKLLHQVITDQIPAAIPMISGRETLITFHAGANDVLRPKYQSDVAFKEYREGVKALTATGATVVVFTVIETVDGKGKTADLWVERFTAFNENVRAVAQEFGAILAEAQKSPWLSDRRFLAVDRLHLNAEGHWRLAQAVLEMLGYPFDAAWRIPLPLAKKKSRVRKLLENAHWIFTFVLPWIWRRVRGRSSGDGRSAKYPTLRPWSVG
jgi:lysophospholipase L1-like esterase